MPATKCQRYGFPLVLVAIGQFSAPLRVSAAIIDSNERVSSSETIESFGRTLSSNSTSRSELNLGRKWFAAGIAATLSGAAVGSVALAIGLANACTPWTGNSCMIGARQRAAWAIAAPSITLLGSGIGMIAYGWHVRRMARLSIQVSNQKLSLAIAGEF